MTFLLPFRQPFPMARNEPRGKIAVRLLRRTIEAKKESTLETVNSIGGHNRRGPDTARATGKNLISKSPKINCARRLIVLCPRASEHYPGAHRLYTQGM